MLGLVDANNFYASCHQVFRPELEGKPIIVLSNRDGNVVARSAEAKALGIKIGQLFFETRELVDEHQVVVSSSNYERRYLGPIDEPAHAVCARCGGVFD